MSKRMVLDEDRLMQQLDKDAQYYLRKYGPQMEALQYSPLARTRDISSFDVCALGRQLQQWDDCKESLLSNRAYGTNADLQTANVDWILSIASHGSRLSLICSTCRLTSSRLYIQETKSQTTRGNVAEGDVYVRGGNDAYPRGFPTRTSRVSLGKLDKPAILARLVALAFNQLTQ